MIPLKDKFTSFKTLLRYEISRFLLISAQTILPPVITTTLYFVIFGQLIGPRIGEVGGVGFMDYIAPGLIMMALINSAFVGALFPFYMARFQHYLEEILVSPMSNTSIIIAYVIAATFRALLISLAIALVALLFTKIQVYHFGVMFLAAILSAVLFSLLGLINAMLARSFDDTATISTFILTPLSYFGGVFYSVSMLPTIWQKISYLNPILYIVNVFRYSLLGISDVPVWQSLGVIALCTIIAFTIVGIMMNKGVGVRS